MANDITAFRLPPEEKHALKILAAEADMTLTDYVLHILREHTDLTERAKNLTKAVLHVGQTGASIDEQPVQSHS